MLEDIGINFIVPLTVFLWIIIGSMVVSGYALEDVVKRRDNK
ncbi:MAG: hypothetical protein ACC707_11690 [Thiohalomonadales bacterium]